MFSLCRVSCWLHVGLLFVSERLLKWSVVTCSVCADFTYISSVNRYYKVVPRNLNWTDAGQECRRLHKAAHLLVINDAAEQSAVAGLLNSTDG